ncbi:MAG: YdhR family protein [Nitrospirae bacterium]|nr:YdhR family protein [Nitrospirota bacterium]
MDKRMYVLILNWDFSQKPRQIFEQLRKYIAGESWKRYENKKGLIQKIWYSNIETGQFGGIYLWETKEAREEEIRTMYRVKAMTGIDPTIHQFDVEAIQEGLHSIEKLTSMGLAWIENRNT